MKRWLGGVILGWVLVASMAQAAVPKLDYGAFGQIPVVHEGRVKPLDSFARAVLGRVHGRDALDDMTASEWLAAGLFAPDTVMHTPLVRVADKRLVATLTLPAREDGYYTYAEMVGAFEHHRSAIMALFRKGEASWSKEEKTFLDLYLAVNAVSQTFSTLTLIQPGQTTLSRAYRMKIGFPGNGNYLDWLKVRESVTMQVKRAVKQYGKRLERYTPDQQQAALLAFHMAEQEALGQRNQLVRLIPAFLGNVSEWYAPWALVLEGKGSPQGAKLLRQWQTMADAYHAADAKRWQKTARAIQDATRDARQVKAWQLQTERWYHQWPWVEGAMAAYMLAFALYGVVAWRPALRGPAHAGLTLGIAMHTLLIGMRMAILERPPVSTLYESTLFVSLIVVVLGTWLDRKSGRTEGRMLASLLGSGLLLLSQWFAREGDTLGVVMAVLNTQFWLATHVVCITIGYGCGLVTGALAHLDLLRPQAAKPRRLQTMALVALLFTAIGTILGGIWADQSWGRFWGWDPKENGALAIVLWLVWVLHGKITGHFKPVAFAAMLALTNVVVALSWFGVNLLSVGLHSYGFTDQAAAGLALFCGAEIVIIALLAWRALQPKEVAHVA